MKHYTLTQQDFLSPRLFYALRQGRHAAVVGADRAITVLGEQLVFATADDTLPPGTAVEVWIATTIVCASLADIHADQAARQAQEEARRERYRQRLNDLRCAAEAFNARLKLPARWDTGYKDVISGLSATSMGDGRNRASVEHILLLEPLTHGRLRRDAGDFLCSSTSAQNGKAWSGTSISRSQDGDGVSYAPQITCKACLKIAERWATPMESD